MTAIEKLRALLDDHEQRYGRGEIWRAASEEIAVVEVGLAMDAGMREER